MRTGLIAQKVGMTRVFAEDGAHVPVTVLKVDNCQVVAVKTAEKDGYTAVQLGVGKAKVKNLSKAVRGHYAKAKVEPKSKLVEFRVTPDAVLEVGAELDVAPLSAPIFALEGAVSFVAELSLHSAHTPLEVVVELGTRLAATAHQITAAGGGADPWRTNI